MGPQSRVGILRQILIDDLKFDSFKLTPSDRRRLAALRIALKTGNATATHAYLYGTLLARNVLIGDLNVLVSLAGNLLGQSTLIGDLTASAGFDLAGNIQDTGALIGDLQITYILAGILAGTNTLVGDLTVTSSLWVPTVDDAANCVADWDFKDSASVTLNSGNVDVIASQGTGLPSATAVSGSTRPFYDTDNADFDGFDEMATSLSTSITARTYVCVFRVETGWASSAFGSANIIGTNSGTGNDGFGFRIRDAGTGKAQLELMVQGVAIIGTDATGLDDGTLYLGVAWYDTTSDVWGFRINGVAGSTGTNNVSFGGGHTAKIGNGYNSNEFWYGDIYRLTAYDAVYGTSDLQIREACAAWRATGDGSLLPIGHPYKSSAP